MLGATFNPPVPVHVVRAARSSCRLGGRLTDVGPHGSQSPDGRRVRVRAPVNGQVLVRRPRRPCGGEPSFGSQTSKGRRVREYAQRLTPFPKCLPKEPIPALCFPRRFGFFVSGCCTCPWSSPPSAISSSASSAAALPPPASAPPPRPRFPPAMAVAVAPSAITSSASCVAAPPSPPKSVVIVVSAAPCAAWIAGFRGL